MAHVSRWLASRRLSVGDLDDERVARFLRARRAQGYVLWLSTKAMVPLLDHLRALGLVATSEVEGPSSPVGVLIGEYGDYLTTERGLASGTVTTYMHTATLFLSWWAGEDEPGLDRLKATDVIDFVAAECRERRLGSASGLACGTRALLRFLFLSGRIGTELAPVVPSVAGWTLAGLPRFLEPDQINRLLASCDRRTTFGRRDYAVLVLLARMGLRAGEVAVLERGDIDWRAGEILLRGKGSHQERLPLPMEAGEAIAGWLRRGRPGCDCSEVFTRVRAPHRRLTSSGITSIVYAACSRAGLPPVGAHRLRHSAATGMLRAGASLSDIGQVLRHRRVLTTSIYAKVDRAGLAALAQPWPGRAS
jgi:integrase/recombinase XerD